MEQAEVEQMCEAGLASLFSDCRKETNEGAIMTCVEQCYHRLRERVKSEGKVLVGVNQTITTSAHQEAVGVSQQVLYMITLVGSVVDAELIKQQQRLQQFNPRNVGRNN